MQKWITDHRLLFAAIVALAVAAHWCFVVYLISMMSGWRTLSRRFQGTAAIHGTEMDLAIRGDARGLALQQLPHHRLELHGIVPGCHASVPARASGPIHFLD
jgi:hypothetical protein